MNILVTGSNGFIGKNLVVELKSRNIGKVFEYDKNSSDKDLDSYCKNADFVFHLAGVNRPKNEAEFMEGNFNLTDKVIFYLKKHGNKCPIMLSSSTQAVSENEYGKSKHAAEEMLQKYSKEFGSKIYIYRLTNIFGKWARPNYNSVIATFCHNIANDLPIKIDNSDTLLKLIYIDDLVDELINLIKGQGNLIGDFYNVKTQYEIRLGEVAKLIYDFKNSRTNNVIPDLSNSFIKKLYATYFSYLPENNFNYTLNMKIDDRGSFTEFIKSIHAGQVSINVAKPGITKGNHWHHTKVEKFLVVSGNAIIRFRSILSNQIISYKVSGESLEVVDIPPGYTHNIENVGNTNLVTVMWANENFDIKSPDTIYEDV